MTLPIAHEESHRTGRTGWLRAAVLGANDGIVSVASVVVGVAASDVGPSATLIAGTAALVAGAISMAAGEYVSVQSQADLERADLKMEERELERNPQGERDELASIYMTRGLDADLARQVADALTAHDALGAHARDELGISEQLAARPIQAAVASGAAFTCGAILPLLMAIIAPTSLTIWLVAATTVLVLGLTGGLAAYAGGASIARGAARVTFWGIFAMALTAGVGALFGVAA